MRRSPFQEVSILKLLDETGHPASKPSFYKDLALLLVITSIALLVHGYHPGVEDDGVYLAAIHRDLNPALYPHDSDFFTLQLQATIFDKVIAGSARVTHLPLPILLLTWHLASIFLVLLACLQIARRCFSEEHVRWGAVCMVAGLLTLPVAGTSLYLIDQYLHPRVLSTAALLFAIVATLDKKYWRAAIYLAVAFLLHPIMGAFGASYCVFLGWKAVAKKSTETAEPELVEVGALLPLMWVLEPVSASWRAAAQGRDYYFLYRWTWYEWLGALGPFLILYWFSRIGRRQGSPVLEHMNRRLILFGAFQLAVAIMMTLPARLERLRPMQPMRYLHLLYLLFVLFAGGLITQRILRKSVLRWALFFVPLCAGMYIAQRQLFPGSSHIEISDRNSRNQWVQAFIWIKENTPADAYFALDPHYMEAANEDFHSFRALAERSAMADDVKDPSVATQVPELSARWKQQVDAEAGWDHFQRADFERLKSHFSVNWAIVAKPVHGLSCPYSNSAVAVCRVD